ncbi:hypothetical protein AALO_G00217670 [Alosa alosa]|uniref:Uncharacterized protein n=2 Tax=Alosa alosa TaxID=278164 RepID=A0AAV6G685_9TELE|nr:hypothetical protein AALO_G00217670 [Alosa alosa]
MEEKVQWHDKVKGSSPKEYRSLLPYLCCAFINTSAKCAVVINKLAGQETEVQEHQGSAVQQPQEQVNGEPTSPLTGTKLSQLLWDVPMCVSLPIEVLSPDQAFPFLDTTLAGLGIEESAVRERVVWVDTKRTQVRTKSGKVKEKEITLLEVRVKAKHPGDNQSQEVLYSTESHTDRSFTRSGVDITPWRHTDKDNEPALPQDEFETVEMTLPLDIDALSQAKTEAVEARTQNAELPAEE